MTFQPLLLAPMINFQIFLTTYYKCSSFQGEQLRKILPLFSVSTIAKEILNQMLQEMDSDIHTPVNNPHYYPLQGA